MKNTYFKIMLLTSSFVGASLYAAAGGNFESQFNAFKAQASKAVSTGLDADKEKALQLFTDINFTSPDQVERFTRTMLAFNMNKSDREEMMQAAVQKVLQSQESLRTVLMDNPDLVARLEKENPGFWGGLSTWFAGVGVSLRDAASSAAGWVGSFFRSTPKS